MSKLNLIYTCSHCGAQFQKWAGRCSECGKWGTVSEEGRTEEKKVEKTNYTPTEISLLKDIKNIDSLRHKTNINEMDRVLGGGVVPGSLILLGGEPGIGKSTIALQLASIITNTLYFSGEESTEQIKIRANRIKAVSPTLKIANETNIDKIIATIKKNNCSLAVIDSIQTVFTDEAEGGSGNITQVKTCTVKLLEFAKSSGIPIILIGQVTKDGAVAGPKTLEHLVDTVLYLEGDQFHQFRILRAVKNRFGSTDEVGVFAMEENGLNEVKNPSAAFMGEREQNTPGNVITCLMEGTRPILVEVQALVTRTVFGFPVRKASGFDLNRLQVLIAVLQKRAGLALEQYDVHLNIVGGIKAHEPAVDLAVALAIASAFKDKPLGLDLASFGEIGLSGEIRPVSFIEKRIKECENLGLKRTLTSLPKNKKIASQIKVLNIKNIKEIITIGN
jgi:DNA repair protein RadA/Sms